MKNTALFLMLFALALTNSAMAIERASQEQFANGREEKDSKTAFQGFIRDCVTPVVALRLRNAELKATFEMRYQAMKGQGLSEAEILKIANETPAVFQLVLHDCKKSGRISPSTESRKIQLTLDQLVKKDQSTKETVARLIRAANKEGCNDANFLLIARTYANIRKRIPKICTPKTKCPKIN